MKRFHFSAESLLAWRAQAVERENQRLQQLLGEAQQLRAAREAEVRARQDAASQLHVQREVTGDDLRWLEDFRRQSVVRERQIVAREADCAKRVTEQRQACVEARRQEELLKRLKEKRLAEWRYEANKELEETASEAFLAKWNREQRH